MKKRWMVAISALALLATACGGGDGQETSARNDDPTSPVEAPDACSLLSHDEAAEVLGEPIADTESTRGNGKSVCRWKVEDGWSMTIEFLTPGTAPGNEFDPGSIMSSSPEPVSSLDGAWFVGLGTVAFAFDERIVLVKVATGDGLDDRGAAEELAPLVRQRIEEAGTSAPSPSDDGDEVTAADGSGDFCQLSEEITRLFGELAQSGRSEEIWSDIEAVVAQMHRAAPPELEADVARAVRYYPIARAALEDANWDVSVLESLALEYRDDHAAAEENIHAYLAANCSA